jgi:transketolase
MYDYKNLSSAIRFLSVDAINKANSGHPGMPLGMADIATVLFTKHLRFNPLDARWAGRDRFIMSNAHGSMLQYALLYLTGYPKATLEQIKNFRVLGSQTTGHPEYGYFDGAIETTGGPLGQGIATAVGMAVAEKIKLARLQDKRLIADNKIFVTVGDGCLMEGICEEAIELAGVWNLNNLIVLWDDNNITIDGKVTLASCTDIPARFEASSWKVIHADGHDYEDIDRALTEARKSNSPTLIDFKTIIGKGCEKENSPKIHGAPLGVEGRAKMAETLGWTDSEFEIPATILNEWRALGSKHQSTYDTWQTKFNQASVEDRNLIDNKNIGAGLWLSELAKFKEQMLAEKPSVATRKASEMSIEVFAPNFEKLIAGSADLTPACLTYAKSMLDFGATNYQGNYLHYGIREHVMGAVMNGLALGGFKTFGGTFFSFFDYVKPAVRMSAIMNLPVVYVMTHDSIGVGEDGPTHQPIEQLAMARATPNLHTIRPADMIETIEAWEFALQSKSPTMLVLSRQNLPTLRTEASKNLVAKGGYILKPVLGERDITLIATGSEVSLALQIAEKFESEGKHVALVSMPCTSLFDNQNEAYKQEVLGDDNHLRVSIEAASTFGWAKYAKLNIGLDRFGESGKGEAVYTHLGLDIQTIYGKIKNSLKA